MSMSKLVLGGGQRSREGDVEEGRDASKVLPEEVWKLILGKVTSPQDLRRCYETCGLFRTLLHPHKALWEFEEALPHLFRYLPSSKLMGCRLVCKTWKETVDQLLQDHPSLRPHEKGKCNPRLLPFVSPMKEKGFDKVAEFVFDGKTRPDFDDPEYRRKTKGRIGVGKAAKLKIRMPTFSRRRGVSLQVFWEEIYKFLGIFGEGIWYLHLVFAHTYPDPTTPAKEKISWFLCAELFELVPQLRKLTTEGLPKMDLLMISFPFGAAPHLETLDLKPASRSAVSNPCPVANDLLHRFHLQLGKLTLGKQVWDGVGSRLSWPNLTELHLSILAVDELQSLLRVAMPNLTKLGLEHGVFFGNVAPTCFNIEQKLDVIELVKLVNALSGRTRLSTLRLHMREMVRAAFNPTDACMLETLKTLELNYTGSCQFRTCYFLRFFPELENLNVFYRNVHRGDAGEDVALLPRDLVSAAIRSYPRSRLDMTEATEARQRDAVELSKYMFSGEMYRSNVWEVLPRLKVFSFQWDVYTRGEYEEYTRRRYGG